MLTSCPHCAHKVHATATKCPSCAGPTGAPNPAADAAQAGIDLFKIIFIWPIYLFIGAAFLGWLLT